MSNSNKSKITNEAIVALMASEIGVTGRAIKGMKKDNPRRFARELIGTLFISAGISPQDVIDIFNEDQQYLNIKELTEKAKLLNKIFLESADVLQDSKIGSGWNDERATLIENTLNKMFSSYRSPENKGLMIEFQRELIDSRAMHVPIALTVYEISVANDSDGFDAVDDGKEIVVFNNDEEMTQKSIAQLFKEIKLLFPEMQPDKIKLHQNEITLTAAFETATRRYDALEVHKSFADETPNRLLSIVAASKEVEIKITDFSNGDHDTDTEIRIGKHFYKKDVALDEEENHEALYLFLVEVANDYGVQNIHYKTIIEKIKKTKEIDADGSPIWLERYVFRLIHIVVDSIVPGLYGDLISLSASFERYGSYKWCKEKWEQVDEKGMIYQYTMKSKSEAFPPHLVGGSPEE